MNPFPNIPNPFPNRLFRVPSVSGFVESHIAQLLVVESDPSFHLGLVACQELLFKRYVILCWEPSPVSTFQRLQTLSFSIVDMSKY